MFNLYLIYPCDDEIDEDSEENTSSGIYSREAITLKRCC